MANPDLVCPIPKVGGAGDESDMGAPDRHLGDGSRRDVARGCGGTPCAPARRTKVCRSSVVAATVWGVALMQLTTTPDELRRGVLHL